MTDNAELETIFNEVQELYVQLSENDKALSKAIIALVLAFKSHDKDQIPLFFDFAKLVLLHYRGEIMLNLLDHLVGQQKKTGMPLEVGIAIEAKRLWENQEKLERTLRNQIAVI